MASIDTLLVIGKLACCLEAAMIKLSDRKAIRISGAVDQFTEFEARVVGDGIPNKEIHIIVRGVM